MNKSLIIMAVITYGDIFYNLITHFIKLKKAKTKEEVENNLTRIEICILLFIVVTFIILTV